MSYPESFNEQVYAESLHDWLDERDAIEREIGDLDEYGPSALAYASTHGDLPVSDADFLVGVTIPDQPDLPF